MKKISCILFICSVALLFASGCATIVGGGGTQQVTFNSTPNGALVSINGRTIGKTPMTTMIERKADQKLKFEKEGYKPVEMPLTTQMNPWFLGNIIFGGLLGSTTDGLSGAINEYMPNNYLVTLTPSGADSTFRRDGTSKADSVRAYIVKNYSSITVELSTAPGEYLRALSALLEIPEPDRQDAYAKIKNAADSSTDVVLFADAVIGLYIHQPGSAPSGDAAAKPQDAGSALQTASGSTGMDIPPGLVYAEFDASMEPLLSGMRFVLVKGGCFDMGDVNGGGENNEKPVHQTCVSDFYMGTHEVTQKQWQSIMGSNPSRSEIGDLRPVNSISWAQAQEYIKRLSGALMRPLRMPTEAEWEYAARSGGQTQKWSGTSDEKELVNIAWYSADAGTGPNPVMQKRPNALGIYDMSGNVEEWCQDIYNARFYMDAPKNDPVSTTQPYESYNMAPRPERTVRGGSWKSSASSIRATKRRGKDEGLKDPTVGLRLAFPARSY